MQTSKLEAENKLTHTTNRNWASPYSGEEEQKLTLVVEQHAEKCVFTHAYELGEGWTWRCRCPTQAPQYGVKWSGMQVWNLLEQQNVNRWRQRNEWEMEHHIPKQNLDTYIEPRSQNKFWCAHRTRPSNLHILDTQTKFHTYIKPRYQSKIRCEDPTRPPPSQNREDVFVTYHIAKQNFTHTSNLRSKPKSDVGILSLHLLGTKRVSIWHINYTNKTSHIHQT